MKKLLQFVVAATAAIIVFAAPHTVLADDHKSILVTGASTGIGRNLTETLAENGYHVYAGARKDKDLAALDAIDNVTAVKLDVTKQDQVDAVAAMLREQGTAPSVPGFMGTHSVDLAAVLESRTSKVTIFTPRSTMAAVSRWVVGMWLVWASRTPLPKLRTNLVLSKSQLS